MLFKPVTDFTAPDAVRRYVHKQLARYLPVPWAAYAPTDALSWLIYSYASTDPQSALAELQEGRGRYYALQFSLDLQQFVVTHSKHHGAPMPPTPASLVQQAVTFSLAGRDGRISLGDILADIMRRYGPNSEYTTV
jgi:hypothetical protein